MKSLTPARLLYLTYFILIGGPLFLLATILCCIVVIIASYVGLPASFISKTTKAWSWCCLAVSLCRVTVRGREHLPSSDAPCVVVANHQSAYDIFVLNAYIGIPFKWVMKQELRSIPMVGKASSSSTRLRSPRSPRRYRTLRRCSLRVTRSSSSPKEAVRRMGG